MINKLILVILFLSGIVNTGFSQFTFDFTNTNPSCYGYTNGSVELTITGGTSPFTISWYNNGNLIASDTTFINNLAAGKYIVEVTDSNGFFVKDSTTLTEYLITTIDTISDAPCYSSKGTLKIYPQNGVVQYLGLWNRYIWNPSLNATIIDPLWSDTSLTTNDTMYFSKAYPKGKYILTIIDSSGLGCMISKEYEIKEPSAPVSMQEIHTHNLCKNDTAGQISVTAFGGTPPYTYHWSNSKLTAAINHLAAGTYVVTIQDYKKCTVTESIDIGEPFQDLIIWSDKHDVSCRDNQDGYVVIESLENCLLPLTYEWSNSATGNSIFDLAAGIYTLTITDANNCSIRDTFDVKLNDVDCITINNVITPDGNGKNDVWIIRNIELYPDCDVSVFDRWGNQVFTKTGGYDNSWDATFDGKILNSGDYYYIVNLNKGDYPPYTGPLKIIK